MQYKGVLFDLDGTLLDTAPDLTDALNYTLRQLGEPECSYAETRAYVSHGARGLLEYALGERVREFSEQTIRKHFLGYYQDNICAGTTLFDGVAELLHALNERGIAWGIVTNKPQALTDALLPYFPELATSVVNVSGDTLEKAKPHPEPMWHACKAMNIAPHEIIYVGDAERDIQAGNTVEMLTLIAGWGYLGEHDTPAQWQADAHLSSPLEILNYLT